MAMTKAQRVHVAELAMELADIAAAKDIDVAFMLINDITVHIRINPTILPKYATLHTNTQNEY
jgi:hypothetical protein